MLETADPLLFTLEAQNLHQPNLIRQMDHPRWGLGSTAMQAWDSPDR